MEKQWHVSHKYGRCKCTDIFQSTNYGSKLLTWLQKKDYFMFLDFLCALVPHFGPNKFEWQLICDGIYRLCSCCFPCLFLVPLPMVAANLQRGPFALMHHRLMGIWWVWAGQHLSCSRLVGPVAHDNYRIPSEIAMLITNSSYVKSRFISTDDI